MLSKALLRQIIKQITFVIGWLIKVGYAMVDHSWRAADEWPPAAVDAGIKVLNKMSVRP